MTGVSASYRFAEERCTTAFDFEHARTDGGFAWDGDFEDASGVLQRRSSISNLLTPEHAQNNGLLLDELNQGLFRSRAFVDGVPSSSGAASHFNMCGTMQEIDSSVSRTEDRGAALRDAEGVQPDVVSIEELRAREIEYRLDYTQALQKEAQSLVSIYKSNREFFQTLASEYLCSTPWDSQVLRDLTNEMDIRCAK
jgi:hypothetical protein